MPFFFQHGRSKGVRFPLVQRMRASILQRAALGLGALLTAAILATAGQPQTINPAPATTEDHVASKGWWPTKRSQPGDTFAGDAACAKCHAGIFSTQMQNAMAKAAFHGSGTPESGEPAAGAYQSGPFSYAFVHEDPGYGMEVSAGGESLRSKIQWTFGAGNHGQTYLLEENGALYEAQVSSFATHHLGLTPGHAEASEGTLQHALGNRLSSLDAARCFSCHTTAWSSGGKFDAAQAIPGVHCEACHGPGSSHIAAVRGGRMGDAAKAILNPAHLSPAASVDFCGACHRTSMDIVLAGAPEGVSGLRFQPYRLEKSRCWNNSNRAARLTCVTCHNPHEPLVHDVAYYDGKCLACHTAQNGSPHVTSVSKSTPTPLVCPKAKSNCTSCHMPRYTVPEMHSEFTDHFIRVVKADEPFPR